MTRPSATMGGRTSATSYRAELLDTLGLGPDANDQEVESAHRDVSDFLEGAPESVHVWASETANKVDEAFALLSGPEAALRDAARERNVAQARARATAAPATAAAPARSGRLPWVLLGALAIAALVIGVWYAGRPSVPEMTAADNPSASASASPSAAPTMDQATLATLMGRLKSDPKDVPSLLKVSDLYFGVGDFKQAQVFTDKVLALDPTNKDALINGGAAQFNQGDTKGAEQTWLKAAGLYPKDQQVHYNLGFVYMTTKQTARMNAEWAKVLEIDPTSELAKTVSSHMGQSASK